jgi:hypothetical protein
MNQWAKNIVQWKVGKTLYLSVVFSWHVEAALEIAKQHKGPVVAGGPAVYMQRERFEKVAEVQDSAPHGCSPLSFHNPLATFTSRGCPNRCPFCIVPRIEPVFEEFSVFKALPVICDNNFLATSQKHQERVVDMLKQAGWPLYDFNQGLDARLFTKDAADRLAKIPLHARFAWDNLKDEQAVADAIRLCQSRTTKKISCYVLIGYKDTPEDALYRLRKVISWGVMPNPMRYQPLDATEKNKYVTPEWTAVELRQMTKYFWRAYLWNNSQIPYESFGTDALTGLTRKEQKIGQITMFGGN